MANEKKPQRNGFQKIAAALQDVVDWIEKTFADPAIAREVLEDLGLSADNPTVPPPTSAADRKALEEFLAKDDIGTLTPANIAQIKRLAETVFTFADSVKSDGTDAWDVFWLVFNVWVADSLRVRNPSAYALCALAGLVIEDDELLAQADPSVATRLLKGEATGEDADAFIDRLSALAGGLVVFLDQKLGEHAPIDVMYGWDPEPGSAPDASVAASRALSVACKTSGPVDALLTVIPVTRADGGPGLLISAGAHLKIDHSTGTYTYITDIGAHGAFSLFFRLSTDDPGFRVLGPGTPSVGIGVQRTVQEGKPLVVLGLGGKTRLEIGGFSYGFELGANHAGFKAHLRKGKLVISLGDGDGFLSKMPGRSIEIPFELGLLADTTHGIRFDGGSGLKVDLPVAASLFGVFRIQFVALELKLSGDPSVEIRGGFSLKLGPFQATVDQLGTALDLAALARGVDDVGKLVKFLPPKGIGLALDLGPVKGGGYLGIDAERGEYSGALELKLFFVGIKAIALITTKRPDGSDGWSLLIFIFAQFRAHIAFGIFLNGVGGLIGLHHRADLNALTAGMSSGALDDVLFPENPVADAARIINRYKQLFPVEPDSLLVGPMLELSFSQPPIAYVRLGLVFEIRNALGDRPAELTRVILLGQLLVQLPPKDLGVPAIVKLLVDVVGFYDGIEKFLLIRARLRDSFVGIEGFTKLTLTGELILAMRFAGEPSFVLSAGGFHPAFKDVPRGVPAELERMAVSLGIGRLKVRNEAYFAITSNSVQAGAKFEVSANIEVAAIKGHLSFDALVILQPKFHFLVQLEFDVTLEALGEDFASVKVRLSLEGPGEWRAKGSFSFSVLWWDIELGFDESWGSAPAVAETTSSAAALLLQELRDPSRLMPGPPIGGNGLVTLAQSPGEAPQAHPLGQVTIAQKAVPLDVRIDRLGTKSLTEGAAKFTIDEVKVGGRPTGARQKATDHFARGQFMELTEQQKLEGRSFETFTSGVRIGSTDYIVDTVGQTVRADYEVKILEPEPELNLNWKAVMAYREILDVDIAKELSAYGAAACSARARSAALRPDIGKAVIREVPLAVVDTGSLQQKLTVTTGPVSSEAVAAEAASLSGGFVVEAYEVAR
ncbi:DUF6603 domain-containing protein [Streptomyces swartbergensis]|uniref:DUF6603 domain-containing protein n=1 Tax=Streptomyces swartbergensis TaxID=487165 RepID=UPI00382E85CD